MKLPKTPNQIPIPLVPRTGRHYSFAFILANHQLNVVARSRQYIERRIRPVSDLVVGSVKELDGERARQWRDRTIQERADLFVQLMRI